ncbi:MAG: YveK family protein [Bacillota bacterium]
MNHDHSVYELSLLEVFLILRKRMWMIAGVTGGAILAAILIVCWIATPIYRSSTTLLVWRTPTDPTQVSHADIQVSRQLVETYREIARSNTVLQDVIDDLHLNLTPVDLRKVVQVSARGETEIIEIAVESPAPLQARRIARTIANSFMKNVTRLMRVDNVVVVDEADLPLKPVKPRKALTVAVAGLVGLMSGVFLAFLLAYLDNTIKTGDDVERYLGLTLLAAVPRFSSADTTHHRKEDAACPLEDQGAASHNSN